MVVGGGGVILIGSGVVTGFGEDTRGCTTGGDTFGCTVGTSTGLQPCCFGPEAVVLLSGQQPYMVTWQVTW